jgi:two-component system response regulator HydG
VESSVSAQSRILIVDDQIEMVRTLVDGLTDRGYVAEAAASGPEALQRVAGDDIDLVVTDLRMPHVDGLQILEASLRAAPDRPVIIMTTHSAVNTALLAIRMGAHHYLTKPFKVDELALFAARALADARLRRETARMRRQLEEGAGISGLAGDGPTMQTLREKARFGADVITIRELQRRYAVWAVGQLGGNRAQAAHRLGIDIKTLRSWLEEDPAPRESADH